MALARDISASKMPFEDGAASQNTQTKSHDDKPDKFYFSFEWLSFSGLGRRFFLSFKMALGLQAYKGSMKFTQYRRTFSLLRNNYESCNIHDTFMTVIGYLVFYGYLKVVLPYTLKQLAQ